MVVFVITEGVTLKNVSVWLGFDAVVCFILSVVFGIENLAGNFVSIAFGLATNLVNSLDGKLTRFRGSRENSEF